MKTTNACPATAMVVCALLASACTRNDTLPPDDEGIHFVRNSEFSGPHLRVFLELADGSQASVNTTDDAVDTRSRPTIIPGHQARDWTFIKDAEEGTSIAYALVSWAPSDSTDYLMAGWWAQFPEQHLPDLDFSDSEQYAIVDGPELDLANPRNLPLDGQATYIGSSGGLYAYSTGTDWGDDEGTFVLDEYEGTIALTADFANGTLSGCVGCIGDLVTRRAHFDVFLGDEVLDVRSVAADYELHLGETPFAHDGTFDHGDVTVTHPEREIVAAEGSWGGSFSSIPDPASDPRLIAGFNSAEFTESDGSAGAFVGAFVALSEGFRAIDDSEKSN